MKFAMKKSEKKVDNPLESQFSQEEREKRYMEWGLFIALVFHIILLVVAFPKGQSKASGLRGSRPVVTIRKFTPPKAEEKPTPPPEKKVKKHKAVLKPIPDPRPEEPEPIEEPEPEPEIPIPPDAIVIFGELEGPPAGTGLAPTRLFSNPPVCIEKVKPEYPEVLRKMGIEGTVFLEIVVLEDGTVDPDNVTILKSPHEYFNKPSIEAVKKWKFKPALQNDKPVAVIVSVKVDFVLRER